LTEAVNTDSSIAPFICIDEEGGTVSRLSSAKLPGYTAQLSARKIGVTGDTKVAFLSGETIGGALVSIGVNVNFAPVADVLTNPNNTAIGSRSYGGEPELVSDMASAFQAGLRSRGVMSSPKHFPGHGSSTDDTHLGRVVISSDSEHLATIEYVPFARLIGEGAEFIMVGHLEVPAVEPDRLPATLSKCVITDVLRDRLGFKGIIVTDSMSMGAITKEYSSADAAVMAIQAGVDMILIPQDFNQALSGLVDAVEDGTITKTRIRESLTRIFQAKLKAGMITLDD
jgi:beta-N-acetylhexosaminidase